MKLYSIREITFLILLSPLAFFLGCSDEGLTKQQKVTKLLTQGTGQWEPSPSAMSITIDEANDASELFPGMTMKFTENKIFTSGNSPYWDSDTGDSEIWPAEDTWTFKDKNADVLIRGSDDREITIVSITSTELVFQIEWDQTTYENEGRIASLPGLYQFTLTKQ